MICCWCKRSAAVGSGLPRRGHRGLLLRPLPFRSASKCPRLITERARRRLVNCSASCATLLNFSGAPPRPALPETLPDDCGPPPGLGLGAPRAGLRAQSRSWNGTTLLRRKGCRLGCRTARWSAKRGADGAIKPHSRSGEPPTPQPLARTTRFSHLHCGPASGPASHRKLSPR